MRELAQRLNRLMVQRVALRSRSEVTRFFDGQSLIEPGVVRIPEWRPDAPADLGIPSTMWGGAGRKP